MNTAPEHPNSEARAATQPAPNGQSRFRTLGLAAILFVAGAGIGAWLVHQSGTLRGTRSSQGQVPTLSDATKAALGRLDSTIEVRFYSLVEPAGVSPEVRSFAGRVEELISSYQAEANGKLHVTRLNAASPALQKAASADGLKPFSADENDAAYLGLALIKGSHKETLPLLAPEWEQALESDLTRALVRLNSIVQTPPSPAEATQTAAVEQVKALVPNVETVSLEEGSTRLREAALAEFKAAAIEMEKQVKEAQQKLADAQTSGSAADQQAAMKNLQQVQATQTDQIKQLAAKSRAQMEALQRLKTSPP